MPANLTPDYLQAEERFRLAETTEEKIEALRDMLALLPKHKGTDHLFADLKRRLAKLQKEQELLKARRSGRGDPFHIPKEGAGQVMLLGYTNVGKSSLMGALTAAAPKIADYPFTTQLPQPGMMEFEDIQIQLVDLPALTKDFAPGGLFNCLRHADLTLLIVDLGDDNMLSQLDEIEQLLAGRRMRLAASGAAKGEQLYLPLKAVMVANKRDADGAADRLEILHEFYGERLPIFAVSARRGDGLEDLRREIFRHLDVVRVYTKVPGKPPDMSKPFTLPRGSTVLDLAEMIHKDFAANLKFARLWGGEKFDGQSVSRDHVLEDRDIIELHT